jgi:3-oxoacyl-ACP reductase-like protein
VSPDNEHAVLSQDDIDSLVGSTSEIDDQKPAPAQPAAAARASPKPASAGAGGSAGAAPADLAQRLAKLEAAVSKAGQSKGGELEAKVDALAKQVQEISSRVNEILQHLPNTMGYGVHETFQCGSCGTQGLVAAHVMCTHCGTQTQLGWWAQT